MDKLEKEKIEKRRKETSLNTMYFNRFLLIRYVTAGFFFINLYWLCSLMMSQKAGVLLPGINMIFIIRAVWEQGTMYSSPIDDAKNTILAYKVLSGVNIMLVVVILTPLFKEVFPFLTDSRKSHELILGIILIGMFFCGVALKRLHNIKKCTDKQYIYAKQLEKTIG